MGRYRAALRGSREERRRLFVAGAAAVVVVAMFVAARYGSPYGFLGVVLIVLGVGALRWSQREPDKP
jgi:hypothetical protein